MQKPLNSSSGSMLSEISNIRIDRRERAARWKARLAGILGHYGRLVPMWCVLAAVDLVETIAVALDTLRLLVVSIEFLWMLLVVLLALAAPTSVAAIGQFTRGHMDSTVLAGMFSFILALFPAAYYFVPGALDPPEFAELAKWSGYQAYRRRILASVLFVFGGATVGLGVAVGAESLGDTALGVALLACAGVGLVAAVSALLAYFMLRSIIAEER